MDAPFHSPSSESSQQAHLKQQQQNPQQQYLEPSPLTHRRFHRLTRSLTHDDGSDIELAEYLNLTNYQQQLMLSSWPKIYSGSGSANIGYQIIQDLIYRDLSAKDIFQKATIIDGFTSGGGNPHDVKAEHGRMVIQLLDTALKSLNKPSSETVMMCRNYGASHGKLLHEGLHPSVWDGLGDAVFEHIRRNEIARKVISFTISTTK